MQEKNGFWVNAIIIIAPLSLLCSFFASKITNLMRLYHIISALHTCITNVVFFNVRRWIWILHSTAKCKPRKWNKTTMEMESIWKVPLRKRWRFMLAIAVFSGFACIHRTDMQNHAHRLAYAKAIQHTLIPNHNIVNFESLLYVLCYLTGFGCDLVVGMNSVVIMSYVRQ